MGVEMEKNSNLAGTRKISPPDPSLSSPKKRVRQSWVSQKGVIFRPLIYGSVLFALGLISLFTGHVVSDIEWSKFRRYKTGGSRYEVDIWRSDFANMYYDCSDRSPIFRPPLRENKSNGYLLIATSGGLNQQRTGVVQLTKFDYRSTNELDEELQKLRYRVNYHALRFTKPIQSLGQKLVKKMRRMSSRFVAVHLRSFMGHKRTIRPNAKKLSSLF